MSIIAGRQGPFLPGDQCLCATTRLSRALSTPSDIRSLPNSGKHVPNAIESFNSYRRTGYPALVPNNYAACDRGQSRRMLYPTAEQNLNAVHFTRPGL